MDKKTAIQIAVGLTLIVVPTALNHIAVHKAGKLLDKAIARDALYANASTTPIIIEEEK